MVMMRARWPARALALTAALAWAPAAPAALAAAGSGSVAPPASAPSAPHAPGVPAAGQWWVDLSLPPPAAVAEPLRRQQLQRVQQQQAQVAAQVRELGGEVTAQVSSVRNALVVRIDPAHLPELQRLPGVRRVRPVLHPHRPHVSR
jgi:hypothetical protein